LTRGPEANPSATIAGGPLCLDRIEQPNPRIQREIGINDIKASHRVGYYPTETDHPGENNGNPRDVVRIK